MLGRAGLSAVRRLRQRQRQRSAPSAWLGALHPALSPSLCRCSGSASGGGGGGGGDGGGGGGGDGGDRGTEFREFVQQMRRGDAAAAAAQGAGGSFWEATGAALPHGTAGGGITEDEWEATVTGAALPHALGGDDGSGPPAAAAVQAAASSLLPALGSSLLPAIPATAPLPAPRTRKALSDVEAAHALLRLIRAFKVYLLVISPSSSYSRLTPSSFPSPLSTCVIRAF
jgi:hypothetical protein